ncbi:alpha/beta hydrolase [Catenuloplanes atrovinosus]|uniref:DUF1023 domain-containing protein n=1 Tax=Catenuloplanes atrovinosus TaxID=137266 RepID=A0AAE3YM78_9ACTN|nr:alpha/beta hydrolase [Catenuloplanes atrovinosus]MDR7275602.1 hypothetical protein [Catenuloplanes atrovinosus]
MSVNLYAEPDAMLQGAGRLAAAAAELAPAATKQAMAGTPAGEQFGRVPGSVAATAACRAAFDVLQRFLTETATRVERLSEAVRTVSGRYGRMDARLRQLYHELLTESDGQRRDNLGLAVATAPATGADPAAVDDWWQRRDADARERMVTTHPELIGALDGVPIEARDRANRALLERALAEQRQLLAEKNAGGSTAETLEVGGKVAALEAIQRRLADPGTRLPAFLVALDAGGDGRTIISAGNPDTASRSLTYVPGMYSNLASAPTIFDDIDVIAARAPQGTAMSLWLNYDAPNGLDEVQLRTHAQEAAPHLTRYLDGLRITHQGESAPWNVLLAHSYGTTTVGVTGATFGIDVDRAHLMGSIGTTVPSVHGLLGVDPGDVTVMTTPNDVAHLVPGYPGWHGPDPSLPEWNGVVIPLPYEGGMVDSHTMYLKDPRVQDFILKLLGGEGR